MFITIHTLKNEKCIIYYTNGKQGEENGFRACIETAVCAML
uniref:Uncharacterized protein n=1 Tax=Anguilla anguilla TaxID=7936 RepID=A0A0E9V5D5_ANGAN